jgi:histone-binding protein RBBP4
VASASEDNVVMVWQPTMRVWAGDEVKVDEKELEGEAMEGVEPTVASSSADKDRPKGNGNGDASLRSQSIDASAASASGADD